MNAFLFVYISISLVATNTAAEDNHMADQETIKGKRASESHIERVYLQC